MTRARSRSAKDPWTEFHHFLLILYFLMYPPKTSFTYPASTSRGSSQLLPSLLAGVHTFPWPLTILGIVLICLEHFERVVLSSNLTQTCI